MPVSDPQRKISSWAAQCARRKLRAERFVEQIGDPWLELQMATT